VVFYLDWNKIYNGGFMLIAFELLAACVVIMVTTSYAFPEPLKPEAKALVWEDWSEPLRVKCGSGLSDYRVMSAVVLIVFIVLYVVFR
jgi:solute:Na+ symporter, SSS family